MKSAITKRINASRFGFFVGTTALLGLGGLAPSNASDMPMDVPYSPPPEMVSHSPDFAATFGAGYQYSDFNDPEYDEGIFGHGGFVDGALLFRNLGGSRMNAQIDGAFHFTDFSDTECDAPNNCYPTFEDGVSEWHIGGVLFWRDSSRGLIGVDGAVGDVVWSGNPASSSPWSGYLHNYRIGVRGEAFLGDQFTFGARAGFISEQENIHDYWSNGWYLNAMARYYATESFSVTTSIEWNYFAAWDAPDQSYDLRALTVEAEYGLDQHTGKPWSIFAGGRYSWQIDNSESTYGEAQAFAGIRVYFGSGNTLRDHHRTGPVDNTNTLFERAINREAL